MMGSCRIAWLLLLAGAADCSDKPAAGDGGTTSATNTATALTTGSTASVSSGLATATTTGGTGGATTAATNTGGSNTTSNTSDAGSLGGMAGMAGADGSTGTTGSVKTTVSCNFSVSHTASSAIGTVQIVTWSTDLPNVSEAHVDFGLTGSELEMTAPVDLAEPDYRTLLLGMKGDREYSFRIVASSGTETCTSQETSVTTGAVPEWVPTITKDGPNGSKSSGAKGFIITTSGLKFANPDRGLPSVYIFDTDGDVVWWTTNEVDDISGARMSWDGKTMWSVQAYYAPVFSVSMDGLVASDYPELGRANHDLAVLPDGGIATMILGQDGNPGSFVEMKTDGTLVTIVPDIEALFDQEGSHPNAVHYYPDEDAFTLSELTTSSIVKFTRTGELVWQLSGGYFLSDSFDLEDPETWLGNHGHHLTPDGRFLFFNNYGPETEDEDDYNYSVIYELLLDQDAGTATKTWEYKDTSLVSGQLGDVQRLHNGNVLITYSNMAKIIEVTPAGEVVQSFDNDMWESPDGVVGYALFGYATFRTSLYGPPPR